jgi:hypothetical protein
MHPGASARGIGQRHATGAHATPRVFPSREGHSVRRRTVSKLRSYSTQKRAEIYARALRRRFPRAEFEVRLSPFFTYAFRYLILCHRSADGRVIAGAWVSK